ncbi:MAG: NAD(P)-dependent oxidoreductase, partial [Comamonas sp.]
MNILLSLEGTDPRPWIEGLRAALPEAQVDDWRPGTGQRADYAVVWRPPQALVDEQPQVQALFNIGAGVDALVALRLPPHTRIVRLDDAGMAVQMAEYVCQAVIRHFRGLAASEQALADSRWSEAQPRARSDFPVGVMGLGVLGSRVARAVAGFDFPVNGWSRTPQAIDGITTFAGAGQLADFLAATRVLVCLLPLTPETENILNRRTLGALR